MLLSSFYNLLTLSSQLRQKFKSQRKLNPAILAHRTKRSKYKTEHKMGGKFKIPLDQFEGLKKGCWPLNTKLRERGCNKLVYEGKI